MVLEKRKKKCFKLVIWKQATNYQKKKAEKKIYPWNQSAKWYGGFGKLQGTIVCYEVVPGLHTDIMAELGRESGVSNSRTSTFYLFYLFIF